ncbi:hypothetical protein D6C87_02553 [Aureobasidium pullulans]|uniref:Adhesin domain-containing protein n=1 Tax=Aureobasidium pullulans TaxID=5580 RepID=A0AB38LSR6_AURPU|nr:hypothetical protein D6C94_07148 [Aureobasidium pullulans]THZ45854.1 hypothetical protein D6C87_02553 [Aureobasidium pullulans]
MVSPIHDDDTDYSDLDEEAPAPHSSQRPSGPKNRERLSERTPLLSTSPPPPAYADVTRLYGAPPYVPRDESSSTPPYAARHDNATEAADLRVEQPQSMGDPRRDPEDGMKVIKKRRAFTNRKTLACLVLILAVSLFGLMTMTTVKHDKSDDKKKGDDESSPPRGGSSRDGAFPHYERCSYSSLSDETALSFKAKERFSFVEVTEGTNNPSSDINGQVHILSGKEDQKDPVIVEFKVAKSPGASTSHFKVDYTSESLRLNSPASDGGHANGCMEIDLSIYVKPGAKFEHLEVATEHLDIEIEPGLFPPSQDTENPGRDDAFYISNTTDFIAVSGDVSAAYWESGRETRIDLTSGSVSGRFALRDILSIKTKSGSIDVNVEPKPESETDPRPASFSAETVSGSIKAIFPVSGTVEDIPSRLYSTKIDSKSGSIHGDYIHGLNTDIYTASGSIDTNILPYSANSTGSWLRTETVNGGIRVNVLPPYENPKDILKRLRSVHKTKSGSLKIKYPQQWEGKIEAVTMSGHVDLDGKDVKVLKAWKGPVGVHLIAQKGRGSSGMDLGTVSGSIKATIGDV